MGWESILVFTAGQIIILIWTIAAIKGDTKVLKTELELLQTEVRKLSDVLVNMASFRGELNLLQERLLLQGKRLDDLQTRLNIFTDKE